MIQSKFPADEIISVRNGRLPLLLAQTAPVLIRKNICAKAGVLNGARGKVVYYYAPTEEEAKRGSVECIIVSVDGYKGNMHVSTPNGLGLPIFRVSANELDEANGQYNRQMMFPLDLAWAFTLHKIQGQEFQRLAIHLGNYEMCHNLDYTAFSRVRDVQNIMILDDRVLGGRLTNRTAEQQSKRALQIGEEERLKELERQFFNQEN